MTLLQVVILQGSQIYMYRMDKKIIFLTHENCSMGVRMVVGHALGQNLVTLAISFVGVLLEHSYTHSSVFCLQQT